MPKLSVAERIAREEAKIAAMKKQAEEPAWDGQTEFCMTQLNEQDVRDLANGIVNDTIRDTALRMLDFVIK